MEKARCRPCRPPALTKTKHIGAVKNYVNLDHCHLIFVVMWTRQYGLVIMIFILFFFWICECSTDLVPASFGCSSTCFGDRGDGGGDSPHRERHVTTRPKSRLLFYPWIYDFMIMAVLCCGVFTNYLPESASRLSVHTQHVPPDSSVFCLSLFHVSDFHGTSILRIFKCLMVSRLCVGFIIDQFCLYGDFPAK